MQCYDKLPAFEGSFAEVGKVGAGTKLVNFLTPDMALKTMPGMTLGYPNLEKL